MDVNKTFALKQALRLRKNGLDSFWRDSPLSNGFGRTEVI